ncbi:DUF2570 domain-containing protein [Thorsellia anophelis]|uniref:DUF2570 domain-containing protein n=1 Tax=Thorsellia anophelis DSM 18579 TaxID=1123402 RepID=A0A1I0D9H6_9GAMM|nr:DUF2570 domain-containing protein [Thorsellia anophelis]SET28625.1 Protein of unknown function [Thorsellia anophelis DSM 18579]
MSKAHLILLAVVGFGLLILGVNYTLSLRDRLTLANDQVTELDTTIKLQSAFTQSMNAVSNAVIQTKKDLSDDENQTKEIVRTIIKTADCSNTLVPNAAADRLRQYADRIRNPASTN